MDSSNDVALYSGLGASLIAVAILVVAVMLYRKNHSEYGVDVIDSSALAGGFQSFNFKTTRQGKSAIQLNSVPIAVRPKDPAIEEPSDRPPWRLMACVCIKMHLSLFRLLEFYVHNQYKGLSLYFDRPVPLLL